MYFSTGCQYPFFLILTIFRVLSLVFTVSLLGLLSLPLYMALLFLLMVAGALRASTVYKEQLATQLGPVGSYLKREYSCLFTLALGSIISTTGFTCDLFHIFKSIYRWRQTARGEVSTVLALHQPWPVCCLRHICALPAHLHSLVDPWPSPLQQDGRRPCACHYLCHWAGFIQSLFHIVYQTSVWVNDDQTMLRRTKRKKG